jgi:mobilization protein NikA
MPRKPGRPRLSDARRRTTAVMVRLSPDEREVITASAGAAGLSLATFLREGGLARPIRPSLSVIDLEAIGQLRRMGNNLNQLLIHTYTHRAPAGSTETLETLLALLEEIKQTILLREARERDP